MKSSSLGGIRKKMKTSGVTNGNEKLAVSVALQTLSEYFQDAIEASPVKKLILIDLGLSETGAMKFTFNFDRLTQLQYI